MSDERNAMPVRWDIHCVEPWDGEDGDYVFIWDGGPIEAATADDAMAIFKREHASTYDNVEAAWAEPTDTR